MTRGLIKHRSRIADHFVVDSASLALVVILGAVGLGLAAGLFIIVLAELERPTQKRITLRSLGIASGVAIPVAALVVAGMFFLARSANQESPTRASPGFQVPVPRDSEGKAIPARALERELADPNPRCLRQAGRAIDRANELGIDAQELIPQHCIDLGY